MTEPSPITLKSSLKILVCAVEPSGDALGADLMAALLESFNGKIESKPTQAEVCAGHTSDDDGC